MANLPAVRTRAPLAVRTDRQPIPAPRAVVRPTRETQQPAPQQPETPTTEPHTVSATSAIAILIGMLLAVVATVLFIHYMIQSPASCV